MRRLIVLPLLLLLALGACGDDSDVTTDGGSGDEPVPGPSVDIALEGRTFTAEAVVGHEVVPGTTITLTFTEDTVAVDAGCNSLTGTYRADGADLSVRDLFGTEMGCDPDLMDQDAWISALLTGGTTMGLPDDPQGISLTAPDGDSLVLVAVEEPSTADAALVGPTWTLDTIIDGAGPDGTASSVPGGVVATITFADDGTAAFATGCNDGTLTYEEDGADTIRVVERAATLAGCTDSAGEVATTFLAVVDGTVTWAVSEQRLTLTSSDGSAGLGFTAT